VSAVLALISEASTSMPWKCPACQLPIQHSDVDTKPRPGARYRCHICRLELILNNQGEHLTVTPFQPDHAADVEHSGGRKS